MNAAKWISRLFRKRRKEVSAEQYMKQREKDPEYLRQKAEREKWLAEREAYLAEAEAPLLADLASLGFPVESAWSLSTKYADYTRAIPLLIEHLHRPYPEAIVVGIVRSLAIKAARKTVWPVLVDEYRKTDPKRKWVKDGLAAALSEVVDRSTLRQLIELARDLSQGESRLLLLTGIRRSRQPEAKQAIEELSTDPQLAKEIASWRRHRK